MKKKAPVCLTTSKTHCTLNPLVFLSGVPTYFQEISGIVCEKSIRKAERF